MKLVVCNKCNTQYNNKNVKECPICKLDKINNYGDEMTLEEISLKMGITKERVRQIEQNALSKLQNPLIRKNLKKLLH
jgi:DNA-directed RNA polymerase sigma subunit (sigma70/sigma32)